MTNLSKNQMCLVQGSFNEDSWAWKTFCGTAVSVPPAIWGAGVGIAIGGPIGTVVGAVIGLIGGAGASAYFC